MTERNVRTARVRDIDAAELKIRVFVPLKLPKLGVGFAMKIVFESINVSNTCLLSREDDIKFLDLFVLQTWNEYNYFPILLVKFSNLNLWVEKKFNKMNNF